MQIEPIRIHGLGPGRYKVMDKLILGILASINLRERTKLSVGTEDQVNPRGSPLGSPGGAVVTLKQVALLRSRFPHSVHIQQVHEEIIGQRFRSFGKDFLSLLPLKLALSTLIPPTN